MLRLIIGRAGSGKTSLIMNEIRASVDACRGGSILLVPEQYSHEAEKELCRVCGDSLSRYAEVMSFTGLARRMSSLLGGGCVPVLDKGGRLLCMALALSGIGSRLRIYGAAAKHAEPQPMLLAAVDELKASCIGTEALLEAAERAGGVLGDKLSDLALITESYTAVAANGRAEPSDRLTVLASQIAESSLGSEDTVYVDGFIDFTRQESEVLLALLRKGVSLTVCLTLDSLDSENEIFSLSRRSALALIAGARELGAEVRTESCAQSGRSDALTLFADRLFTYSEELLDCAEDEISLFSAATAAEECELAAAKALELVREHGHRWRDIAVAVRGFDEYRSLLENTFRRYGVPLFVSGKSDLMSRPLPAMISLAYEIVTGGWELDDIISYMGTGLTGLTEAECDTLGSYIFKWQLRAGAWLREEDWHQHPDGYGHEYDEAANERLAEINALRRRLAEPLLHFARSAGEADTAAGQASALAELLRETGLAERLYARAEALSADGRETLAEETAQLWDITVNALEQSAAILGDTPENASEFGRLFTLMLSKYDVGTIPVSLDRVSAGDFDRMRRRSIRHLIVLGASDERLPRAEADKGLFSDDERRQLLEMDVDLGGAGDSELWREFSLIYNCLSLPSEGLTLCMPAVNAEGSAQRPSFVMERARAMFGTPILRFEPEKARLSAPAPAMILAAGALRGGTGTEKAAAQVLAEREPERAARLSAAASLSRGKLSPHAVEALYGRELKLSASRIDKFASCRFAYFCQYGLKAKPYEPAGFAPPEIGTFLHFVLEKTASEVKARGGFRSVSDEELDAITDRYIEDYVRDELNDFQEKSARFVYLFRRLCGDVHAVTADMARELRRSDFEPLSFELDFSDTSVVPPAELGKGEGSLTLTGIADRVDGWMHGGKLYLRVVDYKTGQKKFSLSDVWYGMGLQMLLYLFALGESGERLYGCETVPAGVMYVPARNTMLSSPTDLDGAEAEDRRLDELRRSGLVLDDPALLEAWENGDDKRYIPVKFKGRGSAESVASAERLGLLSRHITKLLTEMALQLRRGSIAADPFYRTQQENACMNCDYFELCHFEDGQNGEHCRVMPKLTADSVWEKIEGGEYDG